MIVFTESWSNENQGHYQKQRRHQLELNAPEVENSPSTSPLKMCPVSCAGDYLSRVSDGKTATSVPQVRVLAADAQ